MILHPYKNGSEGAKALAGALGIKQIKREGSKFRGSPDKLVINWGSSEMSAEVAKCEVLNKPEAVELASNKLSFFNRMVQWNQGVTGENSVRIPRFVTTYRDACKHFEAGFTLVCRTILNGHSGQGIVLVEQDKHNLGNIPKDCQLYVMYQPKKSEYRIHVLNEDVVDIQKKMRRVETPDDQINWKIRNHDNGFIYAREGVADTTPNNILTNAVNAVKACGLDFGAVDVIWNEKNSAAYVLEINTAPGLSGETLEGYRKRFEEIGTAWKKKSKASKYKVGLNVEAINADFAALWAPPKSEPMPNGGKFVPAVNELWWFAHERVFPDVGGRAQILWPKKANGDTDFGTATAIMNYYTGNGVLVDFV